MTLRIRKPLKAAMLATFAACLLAQTASAAVYVIRKDPAFGTPFDDLGWRASAKLSVPDACLSSNAGFTGTVMLGSGAVPAGCGSSQISNAQLEFYDLANVLGTLKTFSIGSYLADSAPANIGTDFSQQLLTLVFDNGEVVDFETSYSDPVLGGASGNDLVGTGVPLDTFFALNLSLNVVGGGDGSGGGLKAFRGPDCPLDSGDSAGHVSANSSVDSVGCNPNFVEIAASQFPSTDSITRIPEPGTLALVVAALAGVFSLGRRRSR